MKIYAIKVTHTKKGKPRKRETWALKDWFWVMVTKPEYEAPNAVVYLSWRDAELQCSAASSALGCRCKVVDFVEAKTL